MHQLLVTASPSQFTWSQSKLQLALDIVSGLAYLHSFKEPDDALIIHRDLKSRNVLADAHKGIKLSDFGLSRAFHPNNFTRGGGGPDHDLTMTVGIGTIRWTAPELIVGSAYDERVDIYSFGVILTELHNHELPYFFQHSEGNREPLREIVIAHEVSQGRLRPMFDPSRPAPDCIQELSRRCMAQNPADRPSAQDLVVELTSRRIRDEIMAFHVH